MISWVLSIKMLPATPNFPDAYKTMNIIHIYKTRCEFTVHHFTVHTDTDHYSLWQCGDENNPRKRQNSAQQPGASPVFPL